MGKLIDNRLRLDENERTYLLRLIQDDTAKQGNMVGRPITRLVEKIVKAKLKQDERIEEKL